MTVVNTSYNRGGPNYGSIVTTGGDGRYGVDGLGYRVEIDHPYNSRRDRHEGEFCTDGVHYHEIGAAYTTLDGIADSKTALAKLTALARLADKARNTRFHLGKAIAEGRQTVEMATSFLGLTGKTAKLLWDAQKASKHGNFQHALNSLGKAGELWGLSHNKVIDGVLTKYPDPISKRVLFNNVNNSYLQIHFGVVPVISDLYEIANNFAKVMNPPREDVIHSSGKELYHINTSSSPALYSGTGLGRVKVKYSLHRTEALPAQRALGLQDTAGIIWEATTLSFLVDWVLPISDYLTALEILPNLTATWTCTTVNQYTCRSKALMAHPWNTGAWSTYDYIHIIRSLGTGFTKSDIPAPRFRQLDDAMTSSHIITAASLAMQAIVGKRGVGEKSTDIHGRELLGAHTYTFFDKQTNRNIIIP